MCRFLFLDFDGVLNSEDFIKRQAEKELIAQRRRPTDAIDPRAIEYLNAIIAYTGAKVVISSTWRKLYRQQQLERLLNVLGFRGEVVGTTPRFWRDADGKRLWRGDEIQAWLLDNTTKADNASIVILDDDSDMVHLTPWLVQTRYEHGLTLEQAEEAIRILQLPGPSHA